VWSLPHIYRVLSTFSVFDCVSLCLTVYLTVHIIFIFYVLCFRFAGESTIELGFICLNSHINRDIFSYFVRVKLYFINIYQLIINMNFLTVFKVFCTNSLFLLFITALTACNTQMFYS
jgi:hypothetical protein